MPLSVATLQFYPLFKQPQVNMANASLLLQKYLSSSSAPSAAVDLVVLPELCFYGYEFADGQDIQPFLEDLSFPDQCPSLLWAQQHSIPFLLFIL